MINKLFVFKVSLKMESNNLEFNEMDIKNDNQYGLSKLCSFFGILINIFFFIGLLSYFVCSIAFLFSDYKIFSQNENCFLWEYIISYVILLLIKLILLRNICLNLFIY